MKTYTKVVMGLVVTAFTTTTFGQTNIQFTGVTTTPENAIQLHWTSNPNEIYAIQYANGLATNADGSTAWATLYDNYPSHGTNTFWLDTGNYFVAPNVLHPKNNSTRFYRVFLKGINTSAANPMVAITSPMNGDVVSSNLTVSVSASSSDTISAVKLFVDGQEMNPSSDGTNFTINTCEWWNGAHTLFATAKSVNHFSGIPNDTSATYGHAVSSYVTVNFSNLISEVQFSQPYFEPALGQTQQVTATLAANCNWTVQVVDVNGLAVRTQTGSGNSILFNWDGTGDGGTNLPDASYSFLISAVTNGLANNGGSGSANSPASLNGMSSASRSSFQSAAEEASEIYAVNTDESEAVVPMAILPPGMDTNGYTFFSATPSDIESLRASPMTESSARSSFTSSISSSGSYFNPMGAGASGSVQATLTPDRPPIVKGKGNLGTFYCAYQDYYTPSGIFTVPPIPSGNPFVNKWVQVDGQANQTAASHSETFGANYDNPDLVEGFATAMQNGRYNGSVNSFITSSQLSGGIFNGANVGLLACHSSYATSAESDGVIRSYIRLFNTFGGGPTITKLDACHFGGSGSSGLKWMAILGCSVLADSVYNSLHYYGRLPINDDLHLILTTSTVASSAPTLGSRWANNMLGGGTANNAPQTIVQSWFNAGHDAYDNSSGHGEDQHLVITFRVAGWPDAFNETLSDVNNSPSTGNVLDITKTDFTVFNNP